MATPLVSALPLPASTACGYVLPAVVCYGVPDITTAPRRYAPDVGARTDARVMSGFWVTSSARDSGLLIVHAPLPMDASAEERAHAVAAASANRKYRIATVASELERGFGGLKASHAPVHHPYATRPRSS
jgi:hypothetical protein